MVLLETKSPKSYFLIEEYISYNNLIYGEVMNELKSVWFVKINTETKRVSFFMRVDDKEVKGNEFSFEDERIVHIPKKLLPRKHFRDFESKEVFFKSLKIEEIFAYYKEQLQKKGLTT